MRFLFVDPDQIARNHLTLAADQVHYLGRVLRLPAGAEIDVVPRGGGRVFRAILEAGKRGLTGAALFGSRSIPPPATPLVEIGLSALKAERIAWAIQKLTELGVDRIHLLRAERSVRIPQGTSASRLTAIAEAACQQSGRHRVPDIEPPITPSELTADLKGRSVQTFLLEPDANLPRLSRWELGSRDPRACLIGPEGGFTPDEVNAAREAGVELAGLDGNILRAETAAIVSATILLSKARRL